MNRVVHSVSISVIDPLNPAFGFQVRIEDQHGKPVLFTNLDPVTGEDLLTVAQCLKVAAEFVNTPRKGETT